jgi:hypothetical protein
MSSRHPTACDGRVRPRYDQDGAAVAYLLPPEDSNVVLSAERDGGLCYYDTAIGVASWEPPGGSVPLATRELELAAGAFRELPPCLDAKIRLNALHETEWLLLREDATHEAANSLRLIGKVTGAVRDAPWVSLLSAEGVIYFANLLTRETRWFPPHRWMEGWVSRPPVDAAAGSCWAGAPTEAEYARQYEAFGCYKPEHRSVGSFLAGRRLDDRDLLPQLLARRRVDGGAPYLQARGKPQYPADERDTVLTYPL